MSYSRHTFGCDWLTNTRTDVAADFLLNLIAYNLIRIPKLVAA